MQKTNVNAYFANKTINYQTKFVPENEFNQNKPFNYNNNRKFNYNTPNKKYSTEPVPMSVQTRQTQIVNQIHD